MGNLILDHQRRVILGSKLKQDGNIPDAILTEDEQFYLITEDEQYYIQLEEIGD